MLKQDEKAWKAGFMAGNLRRAVACPYPTDSIEALSWTSGKIEGAAKPPGTLPQLRTLSAAIREGIDSPDSDKTLQQIWEAAEQRHLTNGA